MQSNYYSDSWSAEFQWRLSSSGSLTLPIIRTFENGLASGWRNDYETLAQFLPPSYGDLVRLNVAAKVWPIGNSITIQHFPNLQKRPTVLRGPIRINDSGCCSCRMSPASPQLCPSNNGIIRSTPGLSQQHAFRKMSENCPSDTSSASSDTSSDVVADDNDIRHALQKLLASELESCTSEPLVKEQSIPRLSFGCNQCGRKFGKSTRLARHLRAHLGDRPYSCNVCQKKFNRIDHWIAHEGTHKGEKPFRCAWCPYAATRRDIITRHVRASGCGTCT